MRFARDLVVNFVSRLTIPRRAPPVMGAGVMMAPSVTASAPPEVDEEAHRTKVLKKMTLVWFGIVIVVIIACVVFWIGLAVVLKQTFWAAFADTVLLALLIGVWFVYILNERFVSALFGALAGTGAQNALTGEGILNSSQVIVGKILTFATSILPANDNITTSQAHFLAVLFYVIVLLLASSSLF